MGLEAIVAPARGNGMGMIARVVVLYWWWWDGEKEAALPEFRRGPATSMTAMGGIESSLCSGE